MQYIKKINLLYSLAPDVLVFSMFLIFHLFIFF